MKYWRLYSNKTFRFLTNEAKGVVNVKDGYTVKRHGEWTAVETTLPGKVYGPERKLVVDDLLKDVEQMLVF